MSSTFTIKKGKKAGTQVLLMDKADLDAAGQKLYDVARTTYEANQKAVTAIADHLAKSTILATGKALRVKFTFGAKLAVSVENAATSAPKRATTLADYLAAQTA